MLKTQYCVKLEYEAHQKFDYIQRKNIFYHNSSLMAPLGVRYQAEELQHWVMNEMFFGFRALCVSF